MIKTTLVARAVFYHGCCESLFTVVVGLHAHALRKQRQEHNPPQLEMCDRHALMDTMLFIQITGLQYLS